MKFSIVIPTVPGNEYLLKRALNTLLRHKDYNIEYEIIIIANNWDGFSTPVNKGIKMSTGDYVLIMNDDVIIQKTGWENIMLHAFNNPDTGIVGPYQSEQHGKYSAMWFTLIKRKLFDQLGLLDENMNMFSQDIDFGYRAMKEGYNTAFVDVPVLHQHCSTTSKLENEQELINDAKKIFKNKWGIEHDDC